MYAITHRTRVGAVIGLALSLALMLSIFAVRPAKADVSPTGCLANDFTTQLNKSVAVAYDETNPNGATTITYSVEVGNPQNIAGNGCNVDNVTITLTDPHGVAHTLQTGGNYPVGTAITPLVTTVSYVASSADVVAGKLSATATATGSLHDTPNGTDPLSSGKTVSVTVIHPNTTVTVTPSASTTATGGSVNLTVTEQNTGDDPLLNPSVTLTPPGTTTLIKTSGTFIGGDTGNDGILGVGETWTWVVPTTVSASTTYTAIGNATDTLGHAVTFPNYPNERALITVHTLGSPTLTTTASAPVTVGGSIHDTAHLSGGSAPTGAISFNVYGPNDTTCSVPLTPQPTGAIATGTGNYDSGNFVANIAGTYRWVASYAGDANNSATSTPCGDANESVVVGSAAPTITTTLSASTAGMGTPVHDSATLSGATATAGGTVTYTAYTDAACSLGAQSAGTKTVTNHLVPDSNPITFNTPGTYYWQAVYSGDANNVAATSTCQSEVLSVNKFTPSISTILSATTAGTTTPVHDSATLSGASSDAGGTVTYSVFSNASCSIGMTPAGTKTVVSGMVPDSDPLTFATPGTYYWQVTYSGDAKNEQATSTCSREVLTIAAPPPPQPSGCEVDWKSVGPTGSIDFGPIVYLNRGGRLLNPNNPCPLQLPLRFSATSTRLR